MKYFLGQSVLRSSWDQVFAAFWQRYPNPYRYVALGRAMLPPRCLEIGVWGPGKTRLRVGGIARAWPCLGQKNPIGEAASLGLQGTGRSLGLGSGILEVLVLRFSHLTVVRQEEKAAQELGRDLGVGSLGPCLLLCP